MLRIHHGAKPSTFDHAQELRQRQTKAEKILWSLLRNRQLKGKKFRRQHPIAKFVADFYCHESKLAIELDGNFHTSSEAKEYDNTRTVLLNEFGIRVLRFWNDEVMIDVSKVLQKIETYL